MLIVFTLIALMFALNYIFNLRIFIFREMFTEFSYLYFLILLFVPIGFLFYPATKNAPKDRIPWYDILLFTAGFSCFLYFALHGVDMTLKGWSFVAPLTPTIMAVISWVLMLEAIRRTAGLSLLVFVLFFSFFPLFTEYMPGFLMGQGFDFLTTARYHSMSPCSIVGIPISVTATLLFGFIVFGALLQSTGAGEFFLDLASSLLGRTRGGPAKVSILASGLFGSLSGDVSANVISTGSLTIPTMKRIGYPAHYAGAVEACASTGGVLMPPVMGAAAFLIASFLGIPYIQVCISAIIPAILYYFALFMGLDSYAARVGLKGLSREELPSLRKVLARGWFYGFALIILIFFLVVLRMTARAPFYAALILIVLSMITKETRFNLKRFFLFIETVGRYFVSLTPIMAAAGMIMGALGVTGVAHAMSTEILWLAGENLILLLLLGFFASFVLGTGMTITPCYIFLAVTLVPALLHIGLDPLACHLFVMYCGMISFITPPVAIGAFVASKIADASAMKTALSAMKFGMIIYFLPFFFVLNPAMILHGSFLEIIQVVFTCLAGIILMAGGVQGYLLGIGKIGIPLRLCSLISGLLLCFPNLTTDILGIVVVIIAGALLVFRHWKKGIVK